MDRHLHMQSVFITTNVVSSIPAHDDVHSIQDDMIKFINCTSVVSYAKKKPKPPRYNKIIVESGVKYQNHNPNPA